MKPVELTVVVNPYGRSPLERVAVIYPSCEASRLPAFHHHADWMLLWPLGAPKTVEVYTEPKRWDMVRERVAMEPRTYVVVIRRAYHDTLEPDASHDRHWARKLLGERGIRHHRFEVNA